MPNHLPTLIVWPEGSRRYAHLRPCDKGVVVALCRADRPSRQRLEHVEIIDAPLFLIAHQLYYLLQERGEK